MLIEPNFAFIAGTPALCFVDTVADRGRLATDRLRKPTDLDIWLKAAGLDTGGARPASPDDLLQTRELREAIYRCGMAAVGGAPFDPADIACINRHAQQPPLRPRIEGATVVLQAKRPIEAALSTLAADAIAILTGSSRQRIRICPECAMMFVDTSRPGKRRWCSSATGCGNRAKVRRHRAKHLQPE
ncbi:ABATE domain-containing protein [Thalassobaculum sp.]|uniref:CGNR zinc finger domain-containing protein n=1 Tax=Thalassobaculum sp. TaxID=2022740 RepID=UPI0032F00167